MKYSTVAALSVAALASSAAHADFWRYTYSNPSSAWYSSIKAEYDPGLKRFLWDFTAGTSVNGFWLVLSPGPNPKGNAGELAILYLDAKTLGTNSTITPTLTVYGYNGVNGTNSYIDGSPLTGTQTPDRIFSSRNANAASVVNTLTATDNGTSRRFVVELNASLIQGWTPLYPNTTDPWTGLAFGQQLGTWFHPTAGTTTAYGTTAGAADFNFLTSFGYASQASFDTANLTTQWVVPTPGAAALLGASGLIGFRRRRSA